MGGGSKSVKYYLNDPYFVKVESGKSINKTVAFTCLPVGRLADHYLEKAKAGQLLPELKKLETTFEISIEQPKRCEQVSIIKNLKDNIEIAWNFLNLINTKASLRHQPHFCK